MIERFYLKNYLSFKESELNFQTGLIVFTGPSGSGKSILMNSILSSLGGASCEATLCESSVTWDILSDSVGIENNDINIFKHIKKENSRYFVNNQGLSKKAIVALTSNYLKHLSLKDFSDFENENLLEILDNITKVKYPKITTLKKKYKNDFLQYQIVKEELQNIQEKEKKIIELKEFAAFEIKKIEDINPLVGEDEELLKVKKELSSKEKILEAISRANEIFTSEYSVSSALDTLDIQSDFFDDTMNELRATLDGAYEKFSALDEIDVETILNRIEELSGLKRRYGSIEEAIEYKNLKIIELQKYENLETIKNDLEIQFINLSQSVKKSADELSQYRHSALKNFTKRLNNYLSDLYLRNSQNTLETTEYTEFGQDTINLMINETKLSKISTGEFNRLRLAILALKSEYMKKDGGVLMLDEIDANLSGEESMSVAKVLKKLAVHFQIFVISHQPQLTSMGDQHFLVYKDGDVSKTKELDFNERVDEIARIISGDSVSSEAKKFSYELLEANKCVS